LKIRPSLAEGPALGISRPVEDGTESFMTLGILFARILKWIGRNIEG
jgi:hypothetical protein